MAVVYFDASRLFLRGGRSTPTGIDRVVFTYARWLRERPDIDLTPVWSRMGYLSRLSVSRFDDLLAALDEADRADAAHDLDAPNWVSLTASLKRGEDIGLRPRREPQRLAAEFGGYGRAILSALADPRALRLDAQALFFNVNHYGLEHPRLLPRLAQAGVRATILIHDLIPIRFPEFCSPGGGVRHRRRIEATLRHAYRVIANSQSTADDLSAYAADHALPTPRCVVARLGLAPAFLDGGGPPLQTAPYFVCVGTLEPRKNLSFLLSLWRVLAERMGPAAPRLVLVGRRGWENESIVDQLERSPAVLRYVDEVNTLGDTQVARLIAGAVALLSPSFAEGFNLPVVEAQALSTPVIASDIPVHRELARGAKLIDPLDGPAWLAAIAEALAARRRPDPIAPPTWRSHFEIVAEAVGLA